VSLNDTAVARIKSGKHKEALFTLAKAEKILEVSRRVWEGGRIKVYFCRIIFKN
jgi:hypothetical protein